MSEYKEWKLTKQLYPIWRKYRKHRDDYLTIYDYLEKHHTELYYKALDHTSLVNKLDEKRCEEWEKEIKSKNQNKIDARIERYEGEKKFMREHPGIRI